MTSGFIGVMVNYRSNEPTKVGEVAMIIEFNNKEPIYLQIATAIEDHILKGIYQEDAQISSTTELAVQLKINPATAGKAINLLVDHSILYKKRGIGMFVSSGARDRILTKRRQNFYDVYVVSLLEEARKIGLSKQELIKMIEGS